MVQEDNTIENLLELDGIRYVIDEHLGLWVKFEAKQVELTKERPYGIRYSLTLHDRFNTRILGFDNAHGVEVDKKRNGASIIKYDHWHRDGANDIKAYTYTSAGKLMEDFWKEVDKIHKRLLGEKNE